MIFRRNFHGFFSELRELLNNFQKSRKIAEICIISWEIDEILPILAEIFHTPYLSIYRGEMTPSPPQGRSGCKTAAQVHMLNVAQRFCKEAGGGGGHGAESHLCDLRIRVTGCRFLN